MSNTLKPVTVGRVVGLWRYPVKSMGPEALKKAQISWHGVAGDRRWAFVRDNTVNSGFPWLTLRECGEMSQYFPSFVDVNKPDTSKTMVQTPSGDELDVTDPALARELYPPGARLIRQNRGVFDTFPLSLITTQTIAQLGEMLGKRLEVQRFRPNILVEASVDASFPEDEWVGQNLRLGSVQMRIDKRDGRCAVITIDPVTAKRSPKILRAVAQNRQGCLGVYGTSVEPGMVSIGDTVILETQQ